MAGTTPSLKRHQTGTEEGHEFLIRKKQTVRQGLQQDFWQTDHQKREEGENLIRSFVQQ